MPTRPQSRVAILAPLARIDPLTRQDCEPVINSQDVMLIVRSHLECELKLRRTGAHVFVLEQGVAR